MYLNWKKRYSNFKFEKRLSTNFKDGIIVQLNREIDMWYVRLCSKTTRFILSNRIEDKEYYFAGTVDGALAMLKMVYAGDSDQIYMMSSGLNHPDEYPKFEKHSIDIAAGYLQGAIDDGIIKV